MEELLKEILVELQYQTQLMKVVFHAKDQGANQMAQFRIKAAALQKQMMAIPGLKDNSQMADFVKNIMNIIPGG